MHAAFAYSCPRVFAACIDKTYGSNSPFLSEVLTISIETAGRVQFSGERKFERRPLTTFRKAVCLTEKRQLTAVRREKGVTGLRAALLFGFTWWVSALAPEQRVPWRAGRLSRSSE